MSPRDTHILLVDDEPHILAALQRLLRDQPYTIHTASNAREAESQVKRWPIGLVVTDDQMPGQRGTQFLAWLARECPQIVRIVLTGNAHPDTAMRAVNEAQVFRFFAKPADPVRLAIAIREGLEQSGKLPCEALLGASSAR